ncbi:redox-regulated ATPase YchF [Anaerolinea thermophila]|uniref:GTP-binding protein n=1 Tax=Anaerolinea thermophila (strain DSM 14523 / JCM 11388 / NBRC 100420 / UNI-1) TaxID=926569 RepID=E8MZE8_ANATU|nr:redox-regulated ATPase YchF [Anaerolinea thermophila]BAJ64496.1 putative GTP-binding protein [Anaerolinea thermophila UNI-1]
MKLGIIGLPQSGKTTLFNALTRGNQPTGMASGKLEVHTAVVDVPDPRVDRLAAMFKPKKTIYAKVTYADIAGLEGSAAKTGISGALLNQLTQMDGFIQVVRCFEDENVPHPAGSVDPLRDLASMESELILNDLISVERKLERLNDERKKGGGRDKATIDREIALFERFHEALVAEKPLRDVDIDAEEEKMLSSFGFLSRKPMLVVLNVSEGQQPPAIDYPHRHSKVVALQCRLEMEIAQLPPEEAAAFLQEYGIDEPSLNKMIRLSYDLLGLQSFFTVGPDECRAWTVRKGATAPEAAGVIHSDLQKGFIRAEVMTYDDLIALGGVNEVKSHGKLRLEGKEYIVQDGDILNIRFNI